MTTESRTACSPTLLILCKFLLLAVPHSARVMKENARKICTGTYPHPTTFALGTQRFDTWLITPLRLELQRVRRGCGEAFVTGRDV